jgi:hypothetical protein
MGERGAKVDEVCRKMCRAVCRAVAHLAGSAGSCARRHARRRLTAHGSTSLRPRELRAYPWGTCSASGPVVLPEVPQFVREFE